VINRELRRKPEVAKKKPTQLVWIHTEKSQHYCKTSNGHHKARQEDNDQRTKVWTKKCGQQVSRTTGR